MCLIIACVFSFLAFSFYQDGSILNAVINGVIAAFFVVLLVRNILKTKRERNQL
jgi:large-conductance mechanosensitive channel